jgi:hypothetical protein
LKRVSDVRWVDPDIKRALLILGVVWWSCTIAVFTLIMWIAWG